MEKLQQITFLDFELKSGKVLTKINMFYQVFGLPIGTSPVVLVNHALTGNSNIAGTNGWWNSLVGDRKTINTEFFTVIAINIPGNGFDGQRQNLIENYKDFAVHDVAKLFWKILFSFSFKNIFAVIGGSLGGAIAWEMAKQQPTRIAHLIPIATHWQATDWVIANVFLQDNLLCNNSNPIAAARIHAMMLYRTPASLQQKFERQKQADSTIFQVESWLSSHGKKLENRFTLSAYKLMNHLLKTIEFAANENDFVKIASTVDSKIHLISVDSDAFFQEKDSKETFLMLKSLNKNVTYHCINSIHGHDAFLIEYEQLNCCLHNTFTELSGSLSM